MIVSQIAGGLGNQMFQFAAARALSLARGDDLGLDTTFFKNNRMHQGFELKHVFAITAREVSRSELRRYYGWRVEPIALRLASRLSCFPNDPRIVIEHNFDFWPGFADVPASPYLRGYWQSERYFASWSDIIRNDFCFTAPLEGASQDWADRILSDNAVCLHIRRGDYVANPSNLAVHGVCSLDYYARAVQAVAARVQDPVFYVFSDDLPWARQNLVIDFPVYFVAGNSGSSSYRDMQLMSLCRHNVIANSSFSWWGAWLNANSNKVVVAPAQWFAGRPQPKDLYPKSWIIL